jgi:hypothetical protein
LPAGGKAFVVIRQGDSFIDQQTLPGRPAIRAGGLDQPVTPAGIGLPEKQRTVIQKIRGAYNQVHAYWPSFVLALSLLIFCAIF